MALPEVRALFPHTETTTYLNHAATGVLSRPVMTDVQAYLDERRGANINNYERVMPVLEETKEQLARLVGTTADRVEFAPNTSYGLNVLARGLNWKPGDRVVVPGCEFPANVYPFMNLEREGVRVDFIPHQEGTFTLDDVEQVLRPETRLLTLSWVQFLSGFRADLEAIGSLCEERDIIFCVDAIQGLGALQLDVEAMHIDFLATGSHKWLMGMQGLGFLYVTEELQARITPAAGWQHGPVDWDRLFDYELQFHPGAQRFRLGTMNSVGVVALHAALGLHFELGPAWCEKQVLARARQLRSGLADLGMPLYGSEDRRHASGIVTVAVDEGEKLQQHLQEQHVEAAMRNRKLRFSPHFYNSAREIDRVLSVIESFGHQAVTSA